jgi:hypothetical protein
MSVETGIVAKKPVLKKQVKECLDKAPKITGSEGPADVFVNIQGGYSFYTSRDCDRCKYKDSIIELKDENGNDYMMCSAPDNRDCSAKYQTRVVISVQGDLRDRVKEETEKEFEEFKKYVEKLGYIRDYAVNIEGE